MFILKIKPIKGKSDYIQIRDNYLTLISYFRLDNIHLALKKANLTEHEEKIKDIVLKSEYFKINQFNFDNQS